MVDSADASSIAAAAVELFELLQDIRLQVRMGYEKGGEVRGVWVERVIIYNI